MDKPQKAPKLQVSEWIGVDKPLSLDDFKGKVVLMEAFQMLCPSCGSHAMPQIMRARKMFRPEDLVIIGIHTVFEHHKEQERAQLEAFLKEKNIDIPIGIDAFGDDKRLPLTMQSYGLRGTPSQIMIDRDGIIRKKHFGVVDDMQLGAELVTLFVQPTQAQIKEMQAR